MRKLVTAAILLLSALNLWAQKIASTNATGPAYALVGRNSNTNWLYVPVDTNGYLLVNGIGGGGGGGTGIIDSGNQYLIPFYVTNPSGITVGPTNIATDASGNNIIVPSLGVIKWSTDTGISRCAADTLCFGNGTQGDSSATIKAATGTFSGTVSGSTGTFPAVTASTAFTASGTFALSSGQGTANYALLSQGTGTPPIWGPVTIPSCNGSQALGTSVIASGAAATTITVACTGLTTGSNILLDFASNPLGVVGWQPSANGTLTIFKWATANQINISVVNNTGSSITPGAMSLNYYGVP